jgi:hypothetical protein
MNELEAGMYRSMNGPINVSSNMETIDVTVSNFLVLQYFMIEIQHTIKTSTQFINMLQSTCTQAQRVHTSVQQQLELEYIQGRAAAAV